MCFLDRPVFNPGFFSSDKALVYLRLCCLTKLHLIHKGSCPDSILDTIARNMSFYSKDMPGDTFVNSRLICKSTSMSEESSPDGFSI